MITLKDYQVVIVGILIALGAIVSTKILSSSIVEFQKLQNQTIRVTGSASKNVTSDLATLNLRINTRSASLKTGYAKLDKDVRFVKNFLIENGIEENNIEISSIDSYEYYKHVGSYTTNEVEGHHLSIDIKASSKDVKKLTEISRKTDQIVNNDIDISYSNLEYYVSNLDDIKVEMVGEATRNAKDRAKSMVSGTNGKIGVMTGAKMGVFQIVPVNSTDVSDYGINDTTSIEKKVISTVNATFMIK